MRRCGWQASFTLIELLVVVAIIAVLAAMTIPTVMKGIAGARDAQCKKNLRNLQTAAMNYALEHDRALPRVSSYEWQDGPDWHEGTGYDAGWVDWINWTPHSGGGDPGDYPPFWGPWAFTSIVEGALWEYTGESFGVYICPEFNSSSVAGTVPPDPGYAGSNYEIWRSYVMVPVVQSVPPWPGMGSRQFLGSHDASRMMLFTEIAHRNQLPDGTPIATRGMLDPNDMRACDAEFQWWDEDGDTLPDESIGFHHNGRGNAVFLDGHVESFAPLETNDWINGCMGRR